MMKVKMSEEQLNGDLIELNIRLLDNLPHRLLSRDIFYLSEVP